MPNIKATLTKKVGPLPVWAWGGITVGGIGIARYMQARREGQPPGTDLGLALDSSGAFPVDVTGRAPGMPTDWDWSNLIPVPEPIEVPAPTPTPTPQPSPTALPTCTHTHRHSINGNNHHERAHTAPHTHAHKHTKVSAGGRGCNHGS